MPAMKPGPFAQRHLEGFQPTLHCSAPFTNTPPGAWAARVRALEEEEDCASILQQIAACRGAINGLMTELIEGEVRHHVLSPTANPGSNRALAAERLIKILHTYLK
jgi:DNA-binding FrmR family transcriptional regulator